MVSTRGDSLLSDVFVRLVVFPFWRKRHLFRLTEFFPPPTSWISLIGVRLSHGGSGRKTAELIRWSRGKGFLLGEDSVGAVKATALSAGIKQRHTHTHTILSLRHQRG